MGVYKMYGRNSVYLVSPSGRIKYDRPDDYDSNWRDKSWYVYGMAPNYRYRSPTMTWKEMRKRLDRGEVLEGVLFDVDHGTIRMWGNDSDVKIFKEQR
jgi:hypothetical protein